MHSCRFIIFKGEIGIHFYLKKKKKKCVKCNFQLVMMMTLN